MSNSFNEFLTYCSSVSSGYTDVDATLNRLLDELDDRQSDSHLEFKTREDNSTRRKKPRGYYYGKS